jgi:hypothetical protein
MHMSFQNIHIMTRRRSISMLSNYQQRVFWLRITPGIVATMHLTRGPTLARVSQKNKHFQCGTCHKKLNTATALKTHCLYVHKEEITRVPNARPGRDEFGFDVVGMDGIPGKSTHFSLVILGVESHPVIGSCAKFVPV